MMCGNVLRNEGQFTSYDVSVKHATMSICQHFNIRNNFIPKLKKDVVEIL